MQKAFRGMKDETIREVMRDIAPRLEKDYPGWAIFGSAALRLCGLKDIEVRDIDILAPATEGTEAPETPSESGLFRSQRREQLIVQGIEVDISVGLEVRRRGRWRPVVLRETCTQDGIRHASLSECLRLLRLFDRPKDRLRRKQVEAFLHASSPTQIAAKLRTLLLMLPLLFSLNAFPQKEARSTAKEEFADPSLRFGATLLAPNAVDYKGVPVDTLRFSESHPAPKWHLCQWNFLHDLKKDVFPEDGPFGLTYRNESLLAARSQDGTLTLGVDASCEYQSPRVAGGAWPNLLVESNFDQLYLRDKASLMLSFDVRVLYCRSLMGRTLDQSLHTAQALFYFLLRNRNKDSADYMKALWMGIICYDYRYDSFFKEQLVSWDIDTKMYIYQIPGPETWEDGVEPHDGRWHTASVDVLKAVRNALTWLKGRDLFTHTSPDDLQVEGMNFGWETPGTFRCAAQVKNFSLKSTGM